MQHGELGTGTSVVVMRVLFCPIAENHFHFLSIAHALITVNLTLV